MRNILYIMILLSIHNVYGQKVVGVPANSSSLKPYNSVSHLMTAPTLEIGSTASTIGYNVALIGGASYYVKSTTDGKVVDTAFVLPLVGGRYGHLIIGNEIDLSQLGIVQGDLKVLYPSSTEAERHLIRKHNYRVLKKAVAFCAASGTVIKFGGGRYELYVEDGNTNTIVNGSKITIKGVGKDATQLWLYPAESRYYENVFTVNTGVSCVIKVTDLGIYGFNSGFETYAAVLNFGNDTTKVKLIAPELRTGLATTLAEPGRQIYLSYENGYRAKKYTIAGYDSVNKIITVGARDMSGTQPTVWTTSPDTGAVAVHWVADLPTDTIIKYNDFWEEPLGGITFVSSTHTTLPLGNSDTCYYYFNNIKTAGLLTFHSSTWGNEFIEYSNCELQGQGVILSRFASTNNLWEGGVKMTNCIIENTGCINRGSTPASSGGVPDVIYGSGTYFHPNVPTEYINCTFRNNLAVSSRNYSSSLYAPNFLFPVGAKIVAKNCKWINNNDQYHYLGSSALPVEFYDCYFDDSNTLLFQKDATLYNCILDGTPVSPYTYNGAQETEEFGYKISFIDCKLNRHHFVNSLTNYISYNNCYITPNEVSHTFHVGEKFYMNNCILEKNTNLNIGFNSIFHGSTALSPGYMEINNCFFDSTNYALFRRVDAFGLPGEIVIRNSTFKQPFNGGLSVGQNQFGNYLMSVENTEFPDNNLHTTPNISDKNKLLQRRNITTITPTTGTVSYEYTTNWATSAKNLVLGINANHYNVSGGAIDRIVLGHPSNNSQYNDIIYLTAVDDVWFTKYDSLTNPLSNVMFTDTIRKGNTLAIKIDPTTILYEGTSDDNIVIGTGNGTTKVFSINTGASIAIVPKSASVVVNGKTYTDNGRGRFVDIYGKICGYIDYIGRQYKISLIDAPGNGVPVTMNFTKYTTVHYPGVFRKSQ